MKRITMLALVMALTLPLTQSFGVAVVTPQENEPAVAESAQVSVEDFLNMTPKQFEAQSGQKMSFVQKVAFKMAQNKVKKQVAKGKLDVHAPASASTMSLLSLIFGATGLLLLLLVSGILGLALGIAGFVLGLVAMKKEGSNVMNILGTVLGGLAVLLFLIFIIAVASFI